MQPYGLTTPNPCLLAFGMKLGFVVNQLNEGKFRILIQ